MNATARSAEQVRTDLDNQAANIMSGWLSTEQLAEAAWPLAETATEAEQHWATAAAPLTAADVISLAAIVEAARTEARVGRAVASGDVLSGTARHIVTGTQGLLAGPGDDIRLCYLRVTSPTGIEYFWPVSELVTAHQESTFVLDYQG